MTWVCEGCMALVQAAFCIVSAAECAGLAAYCLECHHLPCQRHVNQSWGLPDCFWRWGCFDTTAIVQPGIRPDLSGVRGFVDDSSSVAKCRSALLQLHKAEEYASQAARERCSEGCFQRREGPPGGQRAIWRAKTVCLSPGC